MSAAAARDDFFTMIHKALRAGLFAAAQEAGRIDWGNPVQVKAYQHDWDRVVTLVRSHAKHEDDHIWPLLESKRPGAVVELGVAHEAVDADIGLVDVEFQAVLRNPTPAQGLTFYRALNRFIGHAMEHFADEEPAVMEMLWATCTDEELAACRAGFMAEISPDEKTATLELMLESNTTEDLLGLLQGLRAGMPPDAFASWVAAAEHAMPPSTFARLSRLVAMPAHAR